VYLLYLLFSFASPKEKSNKKEKANWANAPRAQRGLYAVTSSFYHLRGAGILSMIAAIGLWQV